METSPAERALYINFANPRKIDLKASESVSQPPIVKSETLIGRQGYRIRRFDPVAMQKDSFVLVVGARGTGKTALVKNILHAMSPHITASAAMSSCTEEAEILKGAVPATCIYDSMDEERMRSMIEGLERLASANVRVHTALVISDGLTDEKAWKRFVNGSLCLKHRDLRVSLVVTTQFVPSHENTEQALIDYVFCSPKATRESRSDMWNRLAPFIESITVFNEILECSRNDCFMVIDNTSPYASASERIRWYKPVEDVPESTLASVGVQQLDRMYLKRSDSDDLGFLSGPPSERDESVELLLRKEREKNERLTREKQIYLNALGNIINVLKKDS